MSRLPIREFSILRKFARRSFKGDQGNPHITIWGYEVAVKFYRPDSFPNRWSGRDGLIWEIIDVYPK